MLHHHHHPDRHGKQDTKLCDQIMKRQKRHRFVDGKRSKDGRKETKSHPVLLKLSEKEET